MTNNPIIYISNNFTSTQISIPDFRDTPYVITQQILGNQQYYFQYTWNIRHQRAYLSIFRIVDSERVYYLKNRVLLNNINLSKYIHETDWEGYLYFEAVSYNTDLDYTMNDISEKFVLNYYLPA